MEINAERGFIGMLCKDAGGGAEGGGERQLPRGPVNAGVVALQPGKPQHQLEVAKPGDLEGERLRVSAVNT